MDLKSNEPFWLLKNGLLFTYPSLQEDQSCEVLIVGAGITGSLIAHQCIRQGYTTLLIDKREIGNGSTSATTSMLQYEIDVPLHELIKKIGEHGAVASYMACSEAIDALEEICKEIDSQAGFARKKSLYFASSSEEVDNLKLEFVTRQKYGFQVQWLESEVIDEHWGISNTFGGILSEQGASVDAFHLAHELLTYNQNKGLQVYDKSTLVHTEVYKDSTLAILHTGAKITTKKIIYCTGYEAVELISENFVSLKSTYAMVSESQLKETALLHQLLAWNTSSPYLYFRTTDDGRLLVGGEDQAVANAEERDALLCAKTEKLQQQFDYYFKGLPFLVDFVWAGNFGETKDGLPYIGTHQEHANSYFVLGFGGNGITFSVTGMTMVAQWLQGKSHPLEHWFRFGR